MIPSITHKLIIGTRVEIGNNGRHQVICLGARWKWGNEVILSRNDEDEMSIRWFHLANQIERKTEGPFAKRLFVRSRLGLFGR